MKPVSTGTGLCALAGAVLLYPLLHRAAPQAGVINTASAEPVSAPTQSGLPKTRPPFAPAPPPLPPMGGGGVRPDGGVAMQAGGAGGCEYVLGEPLNWFTEAHPLPSCPGLFVSFNVEPTDCDGDGTRDHVTGLTRFPIDQPCGAYPFGECMPLGGNTYSTFSALYYDQTSPATSWISPTGQLPEGTGLFRHSLSVNGESVTVTVQQVVSTAVLQSAVCAVIPCGSQFLFWSVGNYAFYDMDGDGDLDLVVGVGGQIADSTWNGLVWLENTAPSNPPLAADINGDGYVNGKDLAMVLSAWTP